MYTYDDDDMVYKDYDETAPEANDNPFIRGGLERIELNRSELYEVKYFINEMLKDVKWTGEPNKPTAQKIERMIRDAVPGEIQNRGEIRKWILENWSKH